MTASCKLIFNYMFITLMNTLFMHLSWNSTCIHLLNDIVLFHMPIPLTEIIDFAYYSKSNLAISEINACYTFALHKTFLWYWPLIPKMIPTILCYLLLFEMKWVMTLHVHVSHLVKFKINGIHCFTIEPMI